MNDPLLFSSALLFGSSLILGCISIGFASMLHRLYFAFLCWGVFVSLLNHGLNYKLLRCVDRITMICGIMINIYLFLTHYRIPEKALFCIFLAVILYLLSKFYENTRYHMIAHGFVYVGNLLIYIHL